MHFLIHMHVRAVTECCAAPPPGKRRRAAAAAAEHHYHWRSSSKPSFTMHPSSTPVQLIHRTTIALTQLHRLLQKATDILANLRNLYLLHTGQVDPNFQRTFPPLPAPPSFAVPIVSPTSSCDSAPIEPIRRAPQPTHSSSNTPPSEPQPQPPKKKRQPPPPLNSDANWDDWDGEADLKLIELKTDSRLRPNWNYVARRVGFSIEQCQSRWQELQEEQRRHDASIQPQQIHPSPHISPTPTSPADASPAPHTPPPPPHCTSPQQLQSLADYSNSSSPLTPSQTAPTLHTADAAAAAETGHNSEDSHQEADHDPSVGSYFV